MRNYSASIKAKLQNHARAQHVEFGPLMEQYALGRLFWRLSQSRYADRFVLKGAQLFQIWSGAAHRPTRDADFMSYGQVDAQSLVSIFLKFALKGCLKRMAWFGRISRLHRFERTIPMGVEVAHDCGIGQR